MVYHIIYDGNCNLCVNSIQLLEQFDQGQQFVYAPMQDQAVLARFDLTPADCELGVILIADSAADSRSKQQSAQQSAQRWQGSQAIEVIGQLLSAGNLPLGKLFVDAYRLLPGAKWTGDRIYEQVRDHRYSLFGARDSTYQSIYPADPAVHPGASGDGAPSCGESCGNSYAEPGGSGAPT